MWPGLYLYFRGSRRARILIVVDDHVLLVRDRWTLWFRDSHWALPGGGLHPGEDATVGAVRELAEELSLQTEPNSLQLLGVEQVHEYGFSYQGHFILLSLKARPVLYLQANEIVAAEWFPLAEISTQPLKREVQQGVELLKSHA